MTQYNQQNHVYEQLMIHGPDDIGQSRYQMVIVNHYKNHLKGHVGARKQYKYNVLTIILYPKLPNDLFDVLKGT